ncbi:MAG: tRNA (guanosine(46)-N7)-methyltransferase TrmB, partial [Alphaproteobacteria bacterium]|nr:tRNA (guanosine(46)-N7)-methyltransferase TrmB [Alphaproteobacteria bacterium]
MLKSDSIIEKGFFGRRKGRPLRNAQATLMEKALPELSLALPTDEALDLEALFPGFEKVRVEIGFGGGEHLLAQAKANPHTAFIGCEPFVNGVATLLKGIQEEGLQNIKIYTEDGRDLLRALPQHA